MKISMIYKMYLKKITYENDYQKALQFTKSLEQWESKSEWIKMSIILSHILRVCSADTIEFKNHSNICFKVNILNDLEW